ncbi:hypothetical protein LOD99_7850 [Oopsacas minuta]|uniref:Uncharacterized protein n=1 Tax=Oopsacas minuta TaxID=111878 RepID=A0AAV7JQQ3_9METZ|nr:hypothetical protein LOD99_7850 [Oopsacas minuta]
MSSLKWICLNLMGHYKITRRPILHKNAIPCLLPSCPKYLSSPSPKPERLDRGKIENKLFFQALEQSLDLHIAEDSKFGVKSLGDLNCKLEEFELPSSWVKWFSDDTSINLLKLSKDKHIYIPAYVSINDSLTPTILSQYTISVIFEKSIPSSARFLHTLRTLENCIRQATSNIESTISKIGTSNDMLEKYSELLPS